MVWATSCSTISRDWEAWARATRMLRSVAWRPKFRSNGWVRVRSEVAWYSGLTTTARLVLRVNAEVDSSATPPVGMSWERPSW